jgi:NAD+ diphosphatase
MFSLQPHLSLTKPFLLASIARPLAMAASHAFAGKPLKLCLNPESLTPYLLNSEGNDSSTHGRFLVLPVRKGRPLARTDESNPPRWQLGWVDSTRLKQVEVKGDEFVYLGSTDLAEDAGLCHYWSIDVSEGNSEWGEGMAFVELRTLMVATDWADTKMMGQLAIAGHVISSNTFRSFYMFSLLNFLQVI